MLAIGRALISRPRLVMIDEMSLGLAPKALQELFETITHLHRQEGTSFLLVEQAIGSVLRRASRAYVLSRGRIELSGTSEEVAEQIGEVRAAYMGIDSARRPKVERDGARVHGRPGVDGSAGRSRARRLVLRTPKTHARKGG